MSEQPQHQPIPQHQPQPWQQPANGRQPAYASPGQPGYAQQAQPGYAQQAQQAQQAQPAPTPLPDLARGYQSLVKITQPMFGVAIPCVGLFMIGAYGIGIAAFAGLAGLSLMVALIGWLCMVGGVVMGIANARKMVRDYAASGAQFSTLLWLGLILPSFGFVLLILAPLTSRYPLVGGTNSLPLIGLFIVCVLLVPATGLTQALAVRRVEREYGAAGVTALWSLQQGQLAREHELLRGYAVPAPFVGHVHQPGQPGPAQPAAQPFPYQAQQAQQTHLQAQQAQQAHVQAQQAHLQAQQAQQAQQAHQLPPQGAPLPPQPPLPPQQ
ncbi:hypothetical protein ACFSWE_11630 [Leucobacter albus]|uniref:Uncharacterized protein n=1 Tax=Leucobacter albus TaxID=272210 RepID=A0ABW3TQJ7_9MICO